MQLAIFQGFEMGTHVIPITFESPLCWIFWACLLLGFGVQMIVQRKRSLRLLWEVLLLAGLIGCEIACQIITGWDLVLWVAVYFYLLTLSLGTVLAMLLRRLRKGRTV